MALGKVWMAAAAALIKPVAPWRPKPGSSGEACPRCREDYDNCACSTLPDCVTDGWLVEQLQAWPRRVHPDRTIEVRFLMTLAAGVITEQEQALTRGGALALAGEKE